VAFRDLVLVGVLGCSLAGCSFVRPANATGGSDAHVPDTHGPDTPVDARGDSGGSASCLARWRAGTVAFGSAVELTGLFTNAADTDDDDPFITADNLTIYFDSLGSASNSQDVYAATRGSAGAAFANPALVPQLSTPATEYKTSITADGLDAFVCSAQPGGAGQLDIWETTRASTTDSFGSSAMWSEANLVNVDTPNDEYDPAITVDGQHLYFAPVGSDSVQRVAVADRGSDGVFAAPTILTSVVDPGSAGDADPAPSSDDLVLLFSSLRQGSGIPLGRNMWFATRASTTDAFSSPQLVPDVNTDHTDGGPDLSTDGCTLYFSSDRNSDGLHLFVTTML
jgi:Tol biopolymer transport system component